MYTCLRTVDPYRVYSVADWEAAASMALRIRLARLPPPVASKASVADVAATPSLRSRLNDDALESQTWTAPIESRSSACSGLRTMLTSGTSSSRQSLTSI